MFDIMLKVLFYVLVVFGNDNYFTVAFARRCYDCVSITSCESGLQFAEKLTAEQDRLGFLPRENGQLFNNAICGNDTYDSSIPKVCCSDFDGLGNRFGEMTTEKATDKATQETMIAANEETTTKMDISDKDEIEMHPNLRLLPNDMCGEIEGSRIFGGSVPMLFELPWMTLIAYTGSGQKFRCGGSIINSRYILTAAHCVVKKGKVRTNIANVRIGEFDLSTTMYCQGDFDNMICELEFQEIDIEEIIPHEDFSRNVAKQADIALLRLNKPITFRNNVAPICLPVYSALRRGRLGGKNATVAGWGVTENGTRSNKLLKATIPILNDDVCDSYYRRFGQNLVEKSFCAGEVGKDTCGGDSGGPLIIESDFGDSIRMVQFGIISFGPKQCGTQFPGVYTDVIKYMDWILDNIRE